MPFQPQQLSETTFKNFVDRLLRFAKDPSARTQWPPNRSWAQEAMARAMGFASFHAAQVALKGAREIETLPRTPEVPWSFALLDNPQEPDEARFQKASSTLQSLSADAVERAVEHLGDLSDAPRRGLLLCEEQGRRDALQVLRERARAVDMPVLWVQGRTASPFPASPHGSFHTVRSASDCTGFLVPLLAHGSADDVVDAMAGLVDGAGMGGDGGFWAQRAVSMMSAVVRALFEVRAHDPQSPVLDVARLYAHFDLTAIEKLAKNQAISPEAAEALRTYLAFLPGHQANLPPGKLQSETAREQHGYLQMQLPPAPRTFSEATPMGAMASIRLAREIPQTAVLERVFDQWVDRHPKGLIILDGLNPSSRLYDWLMDTWTTLESQSQRLIVAVRSTADLPEGGLRQRLDERLGLCVQPIEGMARHAARVRPMAP